MIPNVVRGSHFRGALDYLFDVKQGARSVKKPTLVCSNMAGSTPWELAAEFAVFERMNTKASKPVLHLSLSAHPNDRLTLEQWDELVLRFMALFGKQVKAESKETPISAELNQFVAIRHSDHDHDHVHLLLNRINLDGEVCYCKWDQNRAQAACRQLEHEFGLTLVAGKTEAEQTAQRTLAQAARVAKAAGLPVPAACQRAPKRLSRKEIARLERQQAETGAVDPRLHAYQEQRQLETPMLPPVAVEPALILASVTQPVADEPTLIPESVSQPAIEPALTLETEPQPATVTPALKAVPSPDPLELAPTRRAWAQEMAKVAAKILQFTGKTEHEGERYRWVLNDEGLTIEAKDGRGLLVSYQRHEMRVNHAITEADKNYFQAQQKAVKKLAAQAQEGR